MFNTDMFKKNSAGKLLSNVNILPFKHIAAASGCYRHILVSSSKRQL